MIRLNRPRPGTAPILEDSAGSELAHLLIQLVGAERFKRPTPCAQDGFRPAPEIVYFQCLLFQAVAVDLLNDVDSD
jgi:hypothetical protein